MKYRKKPVIIDALQWTGKNKREMFDFLTNGNCPDEYITTAFPVIIAENFYIDHLKVLGGLIVWDKCNDGSDQSDAEVAYCSLTRRVDIFRYMWGGMFQGKSIIKGTIQQGNKKLNEKRIHPTQKPVNLYRWICQKYLQKGMKILDTHVGSASSLIAYEEHGLEYVGYEINEDYYNDARKRLEEFRSQITLFDLGMEEHK